MDILTLENNTYKYNICVTFLHVLLYCSIEHVDNCDMQYMID